jgi:hypothetical protein
MARWTGVVIGALILLFWPAPTLTVLIWVAALVALYIGLLELIMAVGGRAKTDAEPEPAIEAAADRPPELPVGTPSAPVPTDGERAGPEASPTVPVPAPAAPTAGERHNADLPAQSAEDAADRRRAGAKADLTTMGDRLDLLDRLSSAHSAGMLTDEEYEATKAQVLGV